MICVLYDHVCSRACVFVCVSELSACTPWNSKDVPTLGYFCVVSEFLHLHTATADANGDDKTACGTLARAHRLGQSCMPVRKPENQRDGDRRRLTGKSTHCVKDWTEMTFPDLLSTAANRTAWRRIPSASSVLRSTRRQL